MCGIVGAVSTRNIVPVLVQGLERLEYRGYDSCGVAVYAQDGASAGAAGFSGLRRARSTSRVSELAEQVKSGAVEGLLGHRPYPLGHARRTSGAQRAPPLQPRHRVGR